MPVPLRRTSIAKARKPMLFAKSVRDDELQFDLLHITSMDACFDATEDLFATSESRARSRWKRLGNTMRVVHHMSSNLRSFPGKDDEDCAGGVGAAAVEGISTRARCRLKGRKGMEGLHVKQNKNPLFFVQDLYVACLKLPLIYFLLWVFLAPVVLGLIFTPLYFMDIKGLRFEPVPEMAKERLCIVNVFLYALSLSTTFGGSPVAAVSPFCLLLANVNTLMAQFLFVFLSGAVFARMSQPSQPIRCAKAAIIRNDDVTFDVGEDPGDKFKVFAVRLVLTGPAPCELVDAKLCLTFRIFSKLPDGSMFCTTHDLELVRPEVSYLRYGLMIRHIINKKSPLYGHTLESLKKGDASFSLTVMGLERTSMQPIFHLQDYFVSDGEVVWDGEYVDFIHINDRGQRVLDHSRVDMLKQKKATLAAAKNSRCNSMKLSNQDSNSSLKNMLNKSIPKPKVLRFKSTSFTRADW